MAAIPQVRKTGPKSYPAAETITGGQLVEGRAASVAGVAAAGSFKVLGVALNDAVAGPVVTEPVSGVLNASPTDIRVLVAKGDELPVTYADAAAFGDKLIAAANGQVTPAGAAPDARTIVGECTELAGVLAGAVGLAWIY